MSTHKKHYRLQAPLTADLGARVHDVSARVRSGELPRERSEEVSDLICEMTETAMKHFFLRPAQEFGLGLTARGIIDLGIRSTSKTVRMALKQIFPRLSPEQFCQVSDYLDEAVHAGAASTGK